MFVILITLASCQSPTTILMFESLTACIWGKIVFASVDHRLITDFIRCCFDAVVKVTRWWDGRSFSGGYLVCMIWLILVHAICTLTPLCLQGTLSERWIDHHGHTLSRSVDLTLFNEPLQMYPCHHTATSNSTLDSWRLNITNIGRKRIERLIGATCLRFTTE